MQIGVLVCVFMAEVTSLPRPGLVAMRGRRFLHWWIPSTNRLRTQARKLAALADATEKHGHDRDPNRDAPGGNELWIPLSSVPWTRNDRSPPVSPDAAGPGLHNVPGPFRPPRAGRRPADQRSAIRPGIARCASGSRPPAKPSGRSCAAAWSCLFFARAPEPEDRRQASSLRLDPRCAAKQDAKLVNGDVARSDHQSSNCDRHGRASFECDVFRRRFAGHLIGPACGRAVAFQLHNKI